MDKEEIYLGDWKRILFGNAPVEFLLEVIIRTIFIYCLLLVVIRLLGKRMSGQLTITELAIMLTLGAIVSTPMQIPDRGSLPGALLLFVILFFDRGLATLVYRNKKIEDLTQSKMSLLVKDGILQLKEVYRLKISREQLFAVLRNNNVFNLGKVKRLYQEATGTFSLFQQQKPTPGLRILPKSDQSIQKVLQAAPDNVMVCINCGNTTNHINTLPVCPVCGDTHWENAVV